MSARRIARELAVILFPQLPKDGTKLSKVELSALAGKAVSMLLNYAREDLGEANGLLFKAAGQLTEIELEHPNNQDKVESLSAVPVTTDELREQLTLIERAMNLVSEALDIPDMVLQGGCASVKASCPHCKHVSEHHLERANPNESKEFLLRLLTMYYEHKEEIDKIIGQAKAKWSVDRMVSIDRDILRLACAEAFFMPDIPVKVCISEAIELAHRFADQKAAKFINGILGDLAKDAQSFRRTGTFAEHLEEQPEGNQGDIALQSPAQL